DMIELAASALANEIVLYVTPDKNKTQSIASLVFFPEKQGIINNAAEQMFSKTTSGYRLEIKRDRMGQNLPESLDGILVLKYSEMNTNPEGIIIRVPLEKSSSVRN
ncbi:MAG TPA: hypothetical protein VHP63_01685, partial [candidate division Zixibacteria bacterium]|nr:hypothetical protein [candidate division Zixibacteria bacterium]